MVSISVNDIVASTGAALLQGEGEKNVRGVQIDSRLVEDGSVFVAFAGERVDGNAYVGAAIEAGAGAVVVTADVSAESRALAAERGCAVLRAADDDPEEFILRLAAEWRRRNSQWIVVGVTGSVGKTTTKDMLRAGIAAERRVHATAGNFNNLIGLPITLLSASAEDEVIVAEMGMNSLGELERLSLCARPDVALVTNVGTSHIGMLGSRENIARAKAEIVAGMSGTPRDAHCPQPVVVLTSDNDFGPFIEHEFCDPKGIEVVYVGQGEKDVVRTGQIDLNDEGLPCFELEFADGWRRRVLLNVPGKHVVADFLLAMAIVDRLGIDRSAASTCIETMPRTRMRLEVIKEDGKPRIIDDSYNASPSSVAAALEVLCSLPCEGRRVAVLGEVGELGREAPRLHACMGAYAAAKPLDLVVFVGGENARTMADAARTMGLSEDICEVVDTAADAVRIIGPVLTAADLVLAKGSRSVGLDQFVKGVLA